MLSAVAEQESVLPSLELETYWPVRELRAQDMYFNFHEIEEYLPGCRVRVARYGEMVLLGGYSYLGLNRHPRIDAAARAAIDKYGTGAHGVRLLAGTLDLHHRLEARIAAFKGAEAAATFSSGFMANLSTIACLVGRGDTVICDKLDHASIVDGCRLSGAHSVRFRHNDMDHLEACLRSPAHTGRKLVIVDAVFSMDGDIIDLPAVSRLCRRYGAILMVDEAHSIGVLGATGHGIEEHFGLPADSVDIKMGTLSKAIPSVGGYVAGSGKVCDFLKHQARGFIYSGALPPSAAAAAMAALDVIDAEPERVRRLHDNVAYFAGRLREAGFSFLDSETAVFPIICGDDWQAYRFAKECWEGGVYVQPIPHPVVPKGTSRLRAAVTAAHTRADLDFCLSVLRRGAGKVGGIIAC
ncbi:MAG TPA: aminotransferase class I/II-fold pyridoxal phosphate-dependent enzyme [Vicinamibacteria bacterium]|nr:aminotransferase class I/II-fold pyridoxal phosphate-dependent enzyme [Vicinamibacteria bacterium]